jgi:hypothetical protein
VSADGKTTQADHKEHEAHAARPNKLGPRTVRLSSVDELDAVSGLGPARVADLRDLVDL